MTSLRRAHAGDGERAWLVADLVRASDQANPEAPRPDDEGNMRTAVLDSRPRDDDDAPIAEEEMIPSDPSPPFPVVPIGPVAPGRRARDRALLALLPGTAGASSAPPPRRPRPVI